MQNSPARSSIDVGSVIADTYTIEALIGRGGMGAVFLASHKRLPGKKVAIKVLHAEMSGEEVLARFKREAEIASRLGHPNIVQVHDFNVMPDGTPYLVLEYLHGESLAQRLRQGPLALDQAMSIVRQVGSALAAAHREGIVHRDLKPQNIFLVPTEVDGRVIEIAKVLDFGISKIRGSQTIKTQDSALLGTPQYMAPEQAMGQHDRVDERTDVFALGAIVYEMLSGRPAFSGETIPEVVFKVVYEQPAPLVVPALPAAIADAIHKAMAKGSTERYPSVSAFAEGLTGQPLTINRAAPIPAPELGFAAGSRAPNTDQEAFAQTMGSGDHAEPARGSAPTVASQGDAARAASVERPRSKRGWIVGVVVGAALIAAGGIYLATSSDDRPHKPVAKAERPRHERVEPAKPAPAPAQPPAVVETAPQIDKRPAAKPAPAKEATKHAPVAKSGSDEEEGDETARQKLRDAREAAAQSDWSRAETLAFTVINSQDANKKQVARAQLLYGIVQCAGRNDEEKARIALRKLAGSPLRAKLLEECHRHQYLLNDR